MSDGITESYHHTRILIQQYLEQVVAYCEHMHKPIGGTISSDELVSMGIEISKLKPGYVAEVMNLKTPLAEYFISELQQGNYLSEEPILMLLYSCHNFANLGRFQKASIFCHKLIIFIDSKWRVADNGVYYQSHMPFTDGDQDILLGVAKKRYGPKLRRHSNFIIFAERYYTRQAWRLERVYQLPPIGK